MYCIARPPWSAEMVVVLSSLNSGRGDNFKALWEARLWLLVMLASWAAASWALVFSFFNIFTRIPVGTELRTPHVFTLNEVLDGKKEYQRTSFSRCWLLRIRCTHKQQRQPENHWRPFFRIWGWLIVMKVSPKLSTCSKLVASIVISWRQKG